MTNDLPPFSHNLPPYDPAQVIDLAILADQLRVTYAFKFERVAQLRAAAEKWKEAHPNGVTSDVDQAESTDQLAQIMAEIDAIHGKPGSIHTLAKKPFLEGGRVVDAVLNAELAGSLKEAQVWLQGPMTAYAREKEARLRREAAEQLARGQQAQHNAEDELEASMLREQAALDASTLKPADLSRTRGDFGTVSSLRGKWTYEVTDINAVPRELLMVNDAAVKAAIKGGARELAGLRIYQETTLSVRR